MSVGVVCRHPRAQGLASCRFDVFCRNLILGFIAFLIGSVAHAAKSNGIAQLSFASATQCRSCHQDIYREWSRSRMARSWSNALFQAEFAKWIALVKQGKESQSDAIACLRCHAPVAAITGDFNMVNDVSREGVTCEVCHRAAKVVQRDRLHVLVMDPRTRVIYGSKSGDIPQHSMRKSEPMASSQLCAGCHSDYTASGIPLERTYGEWGQGPYGHKVQCKDCHMPRGSHRFPGGHSGSPLLVGAATIDVAVSEGARSFQVSVLNRKVGHNFPTGGAHPSQLVLEARVLDAHGNELFSCKRIFEFGLSSRQVTASVRDIADSTLQPGEIRRENFEPGFSLKAGQRIRAVLTYHFLPAAVLQRNKAISPAAYAPVRIAGATVIVAPGSK